MAYKNNPWWASEEGEAHKELPSFFQTMRAQQQIRYDTFDKFIRVYAYGFAQTFQNYNEYVGIDETRMTLNAAQNIIDTMHCAIYADMVVPMAVTQGGDYKQRKRARMLNRGLEGIYAELNVRKIDALAGKDALLCGNGFIKVWAEDGKVQIARVDPRDILVDNAEGRKGKPRCMYQRDVIDRFVCAELYPEFKEAIMKAPESNNTSYAYEFNQDQIDIIEAWHLSSGKGAKDGRHVICIEGATLIDEQWDKKMFPFAITVPKDMGEFWGLSIMRQLIAGQYELEKITLRLSKQMDLFGTTQLLVHEGANVNSRKATNEVGKVLTWAGNIEPKELTPMPAHPQSYQYKQSLPAEMAQFVGTNEWAAQQQVPEGLKGASGKALQVFKDEGSKRYATFFQSRESCSLQLSELIIDTIRDIMRDKGDFVTKFADRNGYEQIEWSDVLGKEADEDSFVLRIFPVSSLSQEPSAKFQQLDVLFEKGVIDMERYRKLFNIPDLESDNQLQLADSDVIEWALDHMVSEGEYIPPQSFDNLELALSMAGKFYNMCRKNQVPDERLELIRDYIVDVQALMGPPPAPPMPPIDPGMMPPPGMPPGMPPDMPPPGMAPPEPMMQGQPI
jgi:hypothetical protein